MGLAYNWMYFFVYRLWAITGEVVSGRLRLMLSAPNCLFCPGGATPLFRPHRYVPSQTVWFLRRFGLKKRYRLCPFWSGIGYGFEGITGVYGGIYRFNSK